MGKGNSEDVVEYLKKLREAKGGAFSVKALKHGGTPRGIAATAATQIFEWMKANKMETMTVRRRDLPELFGVQALMPPRAGRQATFTKYIREHFRARGLKIQYSKGLVDFIKQKQKHNPQI